MNWILLYALQVVVCSGVFTLFYRTVMHRHTSFRAARIYLVASLVCAAVIPALDIPLWRVAPIEIPLILQPSGTPAVTMQLPAAAPIDWAKIALWTLWVAGIALLTVVMARQAAKIASIRRRAEIFRTDECEIALSDEVNAPFSFLATVFIERGTSDEEMRQIVLHEASHIRHRHSHEKIAMEVLKSLLWFNPFAWWAARMLGEVHEFEADRDVLDGGATVEEYLPLIFRQIFGYIPELSVGLGDSLTKKRFSMMTNKMKLTKFSVLRVAGALPLAAGLMLLFSFTSREPEIILKEVPSTVEVADVTSPEEVQWHAAEVERRVVEVARRAAEVERHATEVSAQAPQNPDNEEDKPRVNVGVDPVPPGGNLADFRTWVTKQIRYPDKAAKEGIQGRVTVKFVVEEDGSLSNIEEMQSPDRSLTDEAIRILSSSARWTPGKQDGKPVRVWFVMPVTFTLDRGDGAQPETAKPETTTPPAGNAIDEITVVGYGTQKSADVVGVSIRSDAGIYIMNGNVTEGKPLLIQDGQEITNEQLKAIDPNTIQAISVLKDESATRVYGEPGKNGVILITMKKAGDAGDAVTLSAAGNTPMGVISNVKQQLREAGVTKISYTTSDGKTVSTDIK